MEEGKSRLVYRAKDVYSEFKERIRTETALPKHPEARKNYLDSALENFKKEGDKIIYSFPNRAYLSRQAESRGFEKEAAYRDAVMARPRYYDPIRSYTLIGIPFQTQLEAERKKIRQWCRFYMMTHHMVATCHPAGTKIDVNGEWENIEDIKVNDFVRTHKGRYRRVKEVKAFDFVGHLYKFKTCKSNNEIEITPEHPLFVFDGEKYSWKMPEDINVGDYLVTPLLKEIEDKEEIKFEMVYNGTIPKQRYQRKSSITIKITSELMRLIGYYLSDGYAGENGKFRIYFGLNEYAKDAAEIIEKSINKKAKIKRERNMWMVEAFCRPFCHWLREEFNHGEKEKRIPLWVQRLPIEKQSSLVVGFWRGSGCKSKYEILFSTKSVNLIWGIQTILHRMGYSCGISMPQECYKIRQINAQSPSIITTTSGTIRMAGRSADDFARNYLNMDWKERASKWHKEPRGFLESDYMHYRIDQKEKIPYYGKVYNLEVEEDESYIANGFASHNCLEIFARFPLIGFENVCKDIAVKEYYDELFLDENRLDYENFLVQLGLEYWTVGDAFAFGEFDETLKVWTSEELIDPDLVEVKYFPLLKSRTFRLKIPQHLKELVSRKEPKEEYEALRKYLPDIIPYINRNEPIPIDSENMYQMKCGGASWETYGTPILMRAFRQLMLEEKLNMSQMAIAERLYLPLLLAKLGTPGYGEDNTPWIPTQEQIGMLRDDIELAMSSDFRLMVTHWAVEMQSVFGREVVPDMTGDYEQIERRILSVFGISPSLISGETQQPYASTALNADLLNQRLKSYQKEIKRFVKERYRKVAEEQGFYDYEKKGNRLIPLYDDYLVYDPETGEERIEPRRKLLYPEPIMRVLDLRDEATQRQFLFDLREAGIPVADSTMLIGVEFEFEDELEKRLEEERKKIIAQQRSNLQLYKELKENGYPIPQWLKEQIAGIDSAPEGGEAPTFPMGGPEIGGAIEPIEPMGFEETPGGGVIAPLPQEREKPEESTEQMETMPKPV